MKLHPWDDVLRSAILLGNDGINSYQQFNCSSCGAKQTIDKPNYYYTHARCEECKQITNIKQDGMNQLVEIISPKQPSKRITVCCCDGSIPLTEES